MLIKIALFYELWFLTLYNSYYNITTLNLIIVYYYSIRWKNLKYYNKIFVMIKQKNIYIWQVDVCSATLMDVIHAVIHGTDGSVFCFGHQNLGKSLYIYYVL